MTSTPSPSQWFNSIHYNPQLFQSNNRNNTISTNAQSNIFNQITSTIPSGISVIATSPANSLTQALICGTTMFKGQTFSKYMFFPNTTVIAVPFRFALYDSTFNLVSGSDTLGWNNIAVAISGSPIINILPTSITIPTTGNYYIWSNCNVAIPINSYYASPTSPIGILNLTTNTTDVLTNSISVRIGTLNGLTSAGIPPNTILGMTLTYGTIIPYFILR